MLTAVRNNIQKSNPCWIISFVFLLFFLGSGQELFHNHEPDLEHHHDCPAHQLYVLFGSILVFSCLFVLILSILATLAFIHVEADCSFFYTKYYSRAPPFQIWKK